MCTSINVETVVCELFSAEMAERIASGSDVELRLHKNGRWQVEFVEEGRFLLRAGIDWNSDEEEHEEYVQLLGELE